jgi:cytochrome c5
MYYSAAGGENPAYGFQQPAVYGKYDPPGRLAKGFMEPWPIIGTPDVQGGAEKRLREDGTLNHFTGIAGQEIYRGHRLPSFMYGDLFIPEPVGRLIRRAKVKNENGKLVLYNAYDKAEFMASTDMNFRPIQAKTGPDGALYVLDMYRGIIQEGNWTKKGSKLRPVILRKGLDKNIGKGRIYRIVHEDIKPDKQPRLLNKSAKELLPYLGHLNGWYRNTAQKLIILKEDLSVVSALEEMSLNNKESEEGVFERIHALWTLEGLDALNKSLIIDKLFDNDKRVQIMAIRLSEASLKAGEQDFIKLFEKISTNGDYEINNQIALSLRFSKLDEASDLLVAIKDKFKNNQIIVHSVNESLKKEDENIVKLQAKVDSLDPKIQRRVFAGYDTYNQLCITCHGKDLKGAANEDGSLNAPALMGSARVKGDKVVLSKILLNGLIGEVDGEDYGIMMSLKGNSDNWIANVLSYIRVMNDKDPVHFQVVRKTRKNTQDREDYWTLKELAKSKK